jgi:hypothetical protein
VVKVFDSVTGELLHIIENPLGNGSWGFGHAVAISGTRVVVSAPSSYTYRGSVHVFNLASATPTTPETTLENPIGNAYDYFGESVAIHGMRVVVGEPSILGPAVVHVYDLTTATPGVPVATLREPTAVLGHSVALSETFLVVSNRSVSGALVYDLASGTPVLVAAPAIPIPTPNQNVSVGVSGSRVVVGAPGVDTGATDAGGVYVYDLTSSTPNAPVVTLNNPSPEASDFFGAVVALSGPRVVVGAPGDAATANGTGRAGTAFLYDLASGSPDVPVATLTHPSPAAGDEFGFAVALAGTRAVVGAPRDDLPLSDQGSAHVYELGGGIPVPGPTLDHASPSDGDEFGSAVALSGRHVVVGAPYAPTGESRAGSASVYDLAGGAPILSATLINPNTPAAEAAFGASVAVAGARVVVGAPASDLGGVDAGAVFVFSLAGGTAALVAAVYAWFPMPSARFGHSVAASGTLTAIGAPGTSLGDEADAGVVHIYDLAPPSPVRIDSIPNPSAVEGDRFGTSVALSGTLLVVGTPSDNTGATDAGSVYVYDLTTAPSAVRVASITNPSPVEGDRFGASVALSGTLLIVGTPRDNTMGPDAGSAYVYDIGVTPPVRIASLTKADAKPGDGFGTGVAIVGTRVVVGSNGNETASVYEVDVAGRTASLQAELRAPGARGSVAIEGNTLVLGAREDSTVTLYKGSIHIFGPSPRSLYNHAAAKAGLAGPDAHPLASPFGDGHANLVKYAFGLELAAPDVRTLEPRSGLVGLPSIDPENDTPAGHFRFEFLRRLGSGLIYAPAKSTGLGDSAGWSPLTSLPLVLPIDAEWERVIHEEPVDFAATPSLFGTVRVTLP